MSVGTPFHPRTSPLNRKMQWREWSGYYASSVYADAHDIEYNAIREAAALIDVSPLYKYQVSGPDALRLVDRVITRDATKLAVGGVIYTPWCDEHGKVVDDGTIHRLDERRFRWTAADPQLRWLRQNSAGLDVADRRGDRGDRRARAPGPAVARRPRGGDRRVVRRPALLPATPLEGRQGRGRRLADRLHRRPRLRAVDPDRGRGQGLGRADGRRCGVRASGRPGCSRSTSSGSRPGSSCSRSTTRPPRHAMNPEQNYSPGEIGLGRLVSFDKGDFVGRLALEREARAGGPARRLVGLQLDWYDIEGLYDAQGLPPAISPSVDRAPVPVFAAGRQVGRATSHGWSPILKQAIALASVPPQLRGARDPARGRMDGRGAARPGRRDGRRRSRSSTSSASAPERGRHDVGCDAVASGVTLDPVTSLQRTGPLRTARLTRPGRDHPSSDAQDHAPASRRSDRRGRP